MQQGKALGQSQPILAFTDSGHEELITKGMYENLSMKREMGKENREPEAMNLVCSTDDNEEIILHAVHSIKCLQGDKMSESEDGNGQIDTDFRDEKEEESGSECENFSDFICPVCGKLLHKVNLPDQESIIEDSLYYVDGVCIVNSQVQLLCDFMHRFEKEGVTLDNPHGLTGLVIAVFDELGNCIQFNLVKVYPHR